MLYYSRIYQSMILLYFNLFIFLNNVMTWRPHRLLLAKSLTFCHIGIAVDWNIVQGVFV